MDDGFEVAEFVAGIEACALNVVAVDVIVFVFDEVFHAVDEANFFVWTAGLSLF